MFWSTCRRLQLEEHAVVTSWCHNSPHPRGLMPPSPTLSNNVSFEQSRALSSRDFNVMQHINLEIQTYSITLWETLSSLNVAKSRGGTPAVTSLFWKHCLKEWENRELKNLPYVVALSAGHISKIYFNKQLWCYAFLLYLEKRDPEQLNNVQKHHKKLPLILHKWKNFCIMILRLGTSDNKRHKILQIQKG